MEQKMPLKSGNKAVVDREKCKPDCLKCMKECKTEKAISQGENGAPVVDLDKCSGCGNCVEMCPSKAIGTFYLEGTEQESDPPEKRKIPTW